MAKRLIDAHVLEGEAICLYSYGGARYIPLAALKRAPTVEAVEVVRCRDCKHWDYGDCWRLELSQPDDFCSYSERKDGQAPQEWGTKNENP